MFSSYNRIRGVAIIVMVAICTILFLHLSALGSNCVDIHLKSNKNIYYTYETIAINYEITNHFNSNIETTFLTFGECFIITDQDGHEHDNTCFFDVWGFSDKLFPGQKDSGSEIIEERYHVLFPGTYTCYLKLYKDLFSLPCDTFTYSDTIKFKIIEPSGVEKEALTLYLHADSLHWSKERDRNKRKQAFACYLDLAEKYPQTVYADKALMNAILMIDVADDTTVVINACKKIIEDYPTSPHFKWVFSELFTNYERIKDKSGAIRYLNYLIGRYPNSEISEKARYWLGKIEKGDF